MYMENKIIVIKFFWENQLSFFLKSIFYIKDNLKYILVQNYSIYSYTILSPWIYDAKYQINKWSGTRRNVSIKIMPMWYHTKYNQIRDQIWLFHDINVLCEGLWKVKNIWIPFYDLLFEYSRVLTVIKYRKKIYTYKLTFYLTIYSTIFK